MFRLEHQHCPDSTIYLRCLSVSGRLCGSGVRSGHGFLRCPDFESGARDDSLLFHAASRIWGRALACCWPLEVDLLEDCLFCCPSGSGASNSSHNLEYRSGHGKQSTSRHPLAAGGRRIISSQLRNNTVPRLLVEVYLHLVPSH